MRLTTEEKKNVYVEFNRKNNNVCSRMEKMFKDIGYNGDYYWFIP